MMDSDWHSARKSTPPKDQVFILLEYSLHDEESTCCLARWNPFERHYILNNTENGFVEDLDARMERDEFEFYWRHYAPPTK